MAVYFYYGDEDFLIDSQIETMRSKLNPDFLSMSFKTFDNPEYSELINILRTSPMMFGETLFVINSDKYFLVPLEKASESTKWSNPTKYFEDFKKRTS